jgi:hypothetical protein
LLPAGGVELLKGDLTREILPGVNVAELSLKRFPGVSPIALTEFSELRPVERHSHSARIAV